MNSCRFHQAWDEDIAGLKMHNADWRMQEETVKIGNFAGIAKFSQS